MINLIIGHRGTGKSHWLKIIKKIYKENNQKVLCLDLDLEIQKKIKKTINEIFLKGEDEFRKLEQETFNELIKKYSSEKCLYIALGAGFHLKKNSSWNIIFLNRLTDKDGRIFLNRPLLTDENPLEDYKNLYEKRKEGYSNLTDEIFFRLDHFTDSHLADELFLGLKQISTPLFCLQLNPKKLPQETDRLKSFLKKRLGWGIRFFEIIDNNADPEFIKKIIQILPEEKLLFSSQFSQKFCKIPNKKTWSWDLNLGEPPEGVSILSLHERGSKKLEDILEDFSKYKSYHLKLAIEIFNLKELDKAYEWQQKSPQQRSFLPRSPDGRWKWFRNAFGSKMFLHFIREGETSVLDQPLFFEAIHFSKKKKQLGAVLGDPIHFSATPKEHLAFFYEKRSIPILSIPLKEEAFTKDHLKIFQKLEFVFFAVTSPLKEKAFALIDPVHAELKKLKSVNTLIFHRQKWQAYNTDIQGLHALKKHLTSFLSKLIHRPLKLFTPLSIAVWGGGGVRSSLKSVFPLASFYSARSGQLISGKELQHFDILIWAVGRKRMSKCLWPPRDWTIHRIVDLNYMEDSPGKEWARRMNTKYQDGRYLFKKQAQKQREIFLDLEGQNK